MVKRERALTVQSHVVYGYVGNKVCTFVLQLLGINADPINIVQFSNHSGYPYFKGERLSVSDFNNIVEGLFLNNFLPEYTCLITGYLGSTEGLFQAVKNLYCKLKQANNEEMFYLLDPAFGDDGKYYHSMYEDVIISCYRNELLPLADVITPNQFEAEQLSGIKIDSIASALEAGCILRRKMKNGRGIVIITSIEGLSDNNDELRLVACGYEGNFFQIKFPKLPEPHQDVKGAELSGTGDLFTSLWFCHYKKTGFNVKAACEISVSIIYRIIQSSYTTTKKIHDSILEMDLIHSKQIIEEAKVHFVSTDILL